MDSLERFLTACKNGMPDRPPVWILRQAGRYLPEYRRLRARYGFKDILGSAELSVRVALQPLKRFNLDAAIVFSDILIIPQAAGMRVSYSEGGVALGPVVGSAGDIRRLRWELLDKRFMNLSKTISNLRAEVGDRFPVIGFAGAPFTLACYMVEGGSGDQNFQKTRMLAAGKRKVLEDLLEKLTGVIIRNLILQVESSVNAVMLFDSLAEILDAEDYLNLALPYVEKIFAALRPFAVPGIYYARGAGAPVHGIAGSGADVFAVDWRRSLADVKSVLGGRLAVQGNLDPALLFAGEDVIRGAVRGMIRETGGRGHIVNLGAGIFPNTPVKGVAAMVDEVKKFPYK
jgi:uroporphyrinogen decarboxylase